MPHLVLAICIFSSFAVILDSTGSQCQRVNVFIGGDSTTTRQWDIHVTQYTCAQEDEAGPPGCLQYHTGTTGLFKSFAYLTSNTAAATSTSTTHLQNQNYQVCIRRELNYCYICYASWNSIMTSSSFGLSIAAEDDQTSSINSNCITDYITVRL